MIITDFEQGTEEWLEARIGVLSGTKLKKIITAKKLDLSSTYKEMLFRILDENTTGISSEKEIYGDAIERGNNLEPVARSKYEEETGIKIIETGLCLSDIHNMHGCSPDGWTEDYKGAIEIKCPGFIHVKYLDEKIIPDEYKLQIINYFLVNEKLEWLDFVSYRPEFYPKPLFIKRITKEELIIDISKVQYAIDKFFTDYKLLTDKILF